MDDCVHAFELVVACRRRGVPTVALQHGQFSRYTAGLMGYGYDGAANLSFDRYCVWSEFFVRLLGQHSRLIRSDAPVVGGSPRGRSSPAATHDVSARPSGTAAERSGVKSRVLVLAEQYDTAIQRIEVSPYVGALLAAGLSVDIKRHPSTKELPTFIAVDHPDRKPTVVAGPLDERLGGVDVVVASFSSAIFEAVRHEVPASP
jgi:hypothetical protein